MSFQQTLAAATLCATAACVVHDHPFEAADAGSDVNEPPADGGADVTTVVFADSSVPDVGLKPSLLNLIPNGNFELGNVLFASDYEYAPGINSLGEGDYMVGADGETYNVSLIDAGDHT